MKREWTANCSLRPFDESADDILMRRELSFGLRDVVFVELHIVVSARQRHRGDSKCFEVVQQRPFILAHFVEDTA